MILLRITDAEFPFCVSELVERAKVSEVFVTVVAPLLLVS
jgi:hypothetical protein